LKVPGNCLTVVEAPGVDCWKKNDDGGMPGEGCCCELVCELGPKRRNCCWWNPAKAGFLNDANGLDGACCWLGA
jgi:hypothetical protein